PTAPRTYQRRYGQDILDPEEFYRDQVFLPLLRELKCDPILYPNIHYLLVFLATLPVTTSSVERAFSLLKRVKTYCRSTMGENRLNGLAVAAASIHKSVDIDANKILDLFLKKHPHRLDFGL
ncbi:unnamed protein product, partial [Rotaria magnacalcarata]